jgi:hypothetical protein
VISDIYVVLYQTKPRPFYCARGCGDLFVDEKAMSAHAVKCTASSSSDEWARSLSSGDGVNDYALRYFNQGMLYLAFREFIRYGDGAAAVGVYKWILPLARAQSSHSKYAMEALYLYACTHILLSSRQAHNLTWNRFCNIHNRDGCNIPVDLRIEHVNRTGKDTLHNVGHQNLSEAQTDKIGRALLELHDIGRKFDSHSGLSSSSSFNSTSDYINDKDERIMLKALLEADVFTFHAGRPGHQGFHGLSKDPFCPEEVNPEDLARYVKSWGNRYAELQRGLYSRLYRLRQTPQPPQSAPGRSGLGEKVCYCKQVLGNEAVEFCNGRNCPNGSFIHVKCILQDEAIPDNEDFLCKACRPAIV